MFNRSKPFFYNLHENRSRLEVIYVTKFPRVRAGEADKYGETSFPRSSVTHSIPYSQSSRQCLDGADRLNA